MKFTSSAMNRQWKFYPQHVDKCYCQRSCYCESVEKPQKTHHKFIKIRNESGLIKPRSERISLSGPSSRCTSKCSIQSTSVPQSNFEKVKIDSADVVLTERRSVYEKSKEFVPSFLMYNVSSAPIDRQRNFITDIKEDRIKKVNEFRTQNAQECFSILSNHSINQRLGKYKETPMHTCEYIYRLNERGLLSPANTNDEGNPICSVCNKVKEISNPRGIVPLFDTATKPQKLLLQIQDMSEKKQKDTRSKSQNIPASSLALRYQRLS